VLENRMLRTIFAIFESKREEVPGGWKRVHSEELHNLHASPTITVIKSRSVRWVNIAFMGEIRNIYKILIGKPEGKRSCGRPTHRWKDIRMDLRETGW
jgi:hypothetical protein